jgi:PAS domain-containing protein
MPKSVHEPDPIPAAGPDKSATNGEGSWGLDLWSGTAWFNDWFYQRLNWPFHAKRTRLDDLRPHLSAEAWQALLQGIRAHLELQVPFDVQLRVQFTDGEFHWWQVQGSAERNVGGQPVNLVGSARDVSAEL